MNSPSPFAGRRHTFRSLHEQGCFLLPNPWDVGGAVRLARMGFKAIASSSSACAMALGRTDYHITLQEALDHLRMLVGATDLPVNADFENGFADDPAGVAENVRKAIATGVAGLSIEDRFNKTLYPDQQAIERIVAAKRAIRDSGEDVILVARTEAYLVGHSDPKPVIARLIQFAEAGADCLYAPGVTDMAIISDIIKAVAPKPVNVLMYGPNMKVSDLANAGVRRISLGGALAGAAWQAFDRAAKEFLAQV
jgi:2-methylisocitrate lyase-like PEP mutase family enzyme